MDDVIALTGLTVTGRHGVFAHERRDGQPFTVDVELRVDTTDAAATDDLRHTVDYGGLAQRLAAVIGGDPVDLLETLAQRLADVCLADDRVAAATVTVHKPRAPIPLDFADVSVRITRAAAAPVIVALGSNLGDRLAHLQRGLDLLAAHPMVRVAAVSAVYETAPVGGPEQGAYLNAVARLDTSLPPDALLGVCHVVEAAEGRVREIRWGARTLDIDLIAHGRARRSGPGLVLPHPRAAERAFVLAPWLNLDSAALLPGAGPVRALLERVGTAGVARRDELALEVPA